MKKSIYGGLILGAFFIYVLEYTDLITAPVNDPVGFIDNEIKGIDVNQQEMNLAAFLLTIRKYESSTGDDAWNMLVGGGKFIGFDDHPRIAVFIPKLGQYSTAAGAYQITAISKTPRGMTKVNTWDRLKKKLKLPDFSPESQTKAAVELIKERGAYYNVLNGDFATAVDKCKTEWASMPGAPYPDQPQARYNEYASSFQSFGGVIAT